MIIGFVIWSIVAVIFFYIGVSCWKSKIAVGFFTGIKPPNVAPENIEKYNHAIAILWFVSAFLFEIASVPLLLMEQNSPLFVFVIFFMIALVIGMAVVFIRIENKYKKV